MPFILAGSSLRVHLRVDEFLLTTSETAPTVAYVAGGSLTGFAAPLYGSRALSFGPPASSGDVIVTAVGSDVEFETLARGQINGTQQVVAEIGPDGFPTGLLLVGGSTLSVGGLGSVEFSTIEGLPTDNTALNTALNAKVNASLLGAASGVAQLGADQKLLSAQVPDSLAGGLSYLGTWNAATNTPAIPAASTSNKGQYRKVATAGTTNIDGIASWGVGDWIVSNGTTWDKIVNSETVSSVAGKTGAVTLAKADVGLSNVDNTSDATERAAVATLTNKTIDGGTNTLQNIAQSSVTGLVSGLLAKIRASNGAPTGGSDGEYAARMDKPFVGLPYLRTAGVWNALDQNYTWAGKPTPSSTYSGIVITITDVGYGGSDFICKSRDGGTTWAWEPLAPLTLFTITADTAAVTNSVLTFQQCVTYVPPVGLVQPGQHLYCQMRGRRSAGTVGYTPQMLYGSTDCGGASGVISNNFVRARAHGDSRATNVVRWEQAGAGAGDNQSSNTALTSITIDGTTAFRWGSTFSTTADSTTSVLFEMIQLQLVP